jgi:hypothetical protein
MDVVIQQIKTYVRRRQQLGLSQDQDVFVGDGRYGNHRFLGPLQGLPGVRGHLRRYRHPMLEEDVHGGTVPRLFLSTEVSLRSESIYLNSRYCLRLAPPLYLGKSLSLNRIRFYSPENRVTSK